MIVQKVCSRFPCNCQPEKQKQFSVIVRWWKVWSAFCLLKTDPAGHVLLPACEKSAKTENRNKSVKTLVSSPAPLFDPYEKLDQPYLSQKQRQSICQLIWGLKAREVEGFQFILICLKSFTNLLFTQNRRQKHILNCYLVEILMSSSKQKSELYYSVQNRKQKFVNLLETEIWTISELQNVNYFTQGKSFKSNFTPRKARKLRQILQFYLNPTKLR